MRSDLPSLELIRGFEAAARQLSFTLAAKELFVTQSAVSRQVKALEDQLGVPLFERRHRAIRLTPAGQALYRAAGDALRLLNDAAANLRETGRAKSVTVSCSVGFASLWLVPRLMGFRDAHPDVDIRIDANNRILDLERERIELAVRYCSPQLAPEGAKRLLGEEVFPVCAPPLLTRPGRPLAAPEDLRHHVLLHYGADDSQFPSGSWTLWLEAMQIRNLKPAGSLRFSHYDQVIQAAVDGQGVALGISPLVRRHVQAGRLVAPFEQRFASPRGYYLVTSRQAAPRPEVGDFVAWLLHEATQDVESN